MTDETSRLPVDDERPATAASLTEEAAPQYYPAGDATAQGPVQDTMQAPVQNPVQQPGTEPETGPVTRPLRMRTVVLGVILLAVAALSLIDTTTSMNVDLGTTVLALMIGCGVLLIAGARRE